MVARIACLPARLLLETKHASYLIDSRPPFVSHLAQTNSLTMKMPASMVANWSKHIGELE